MSNNIWQPFAAIWAILIDNYINLLLLTITKVPDVIQMYMYTYMYLEQA